MTARITTESQRFICDGPPFMQPLRNGLSGQGSSQGACQNTVQKLKASLERRQNWHF